MMSMVRCDECDHMIDSDEDCDCFGEFGKAQATLCKWCREANEVDEPEIKVGQAIRAVLAAADDLIILANREDTRSLVCKEKIALGQLLTRVETLCSFALAVRPAPLLVRQRVS